ncbi:glycosyltransferase [Allobaculum sp. JKK-2023]|uniref:glycosyltransferase n=1 Tax=Allobaculum sp. JKK-2023 TaxID=3108943 RepID=UPI002B060B55|nr:glycosyltransferase [Allobaculum sp. JKK-2023]
MEKRILSICISTFNRPKDVYEKVLSITKCQSEDFDIIIQDCSTNDETYELLKNIRDGRLLYFRKQVKKHDTNSVMDCWKTVLVFADGLFALNINDRDNINIGELPRFISFLKNHTDMAGGVCKNVVGISKYRTIKKAFLHIPYNSYHPSGVVINTSLLQNIKNIDALFKEENCYIHPHDLLLAELSCLGPMFSYKRKLWSLADEISFKNSASYLYDDNKDVEEFWFSPKNRLIEYELFIEHMISLNLQNELIEKKIANISKRYLYLSTINYAYFLGDKGQTAHYGIKPRKVDIKELIDLKNAYITNSVEVLEKHGIALQQKKYITLINMYFIYLLIISPIWNIVKKSV